MDTIIVYSKDYCPFCKSAKALLRSKGLKFIEIDVQKRPKKLQEMLERSKRRTVPQIFFGDKHIGGSDDLQHYFAKQKNKKSRR